MLPSTHVIPSDRSEHGFLVVLQSQTGSAIWQPSGMSLPATEGSEGSLWPCNAVGLQGSPQLLDPAADSHPGPRGVAQ